jgi:NAD(P)H-quinone oxidoreductase subunit 3
MDPQLGRVSLGQSPLILKVCLNVEHTIERTDHVYPPACMFVLSGYDYFLVFLVICTLLPVVALVAQQLLAPKRGKNIRRTTYESGMEPLGQAWIQFNIRYYMFALVFVIFDVETVFLYPWAVAFHKLGLLAFVEALIFIAILVIGLVYAWRKGALEWS